MTALWQQVKEEIRVQLNQFRPFVAFAGEETDGRVTIRRVTEIAAGTEEFARVAGLQFAEDDEIVCLIVGGKPLPIGRLQRSGLSDHGISYRIAPQDIAGRYYSNRNVQGGTETSAGFNNNQLYAYPFYVGPDGFSADRIGINVAGAAAGNVRLGTYAMHATDFKPGALIADHGTVSVSTTGFKEITISQAFAADPPHYIIWLAAITNVIPTLTAIGSTLPVFGMGAGANSYTGMYNLMTYAALPNPFPTPSLDTSAGMRISLRRA